MKTLLLSLALLYAAPGRAENAPRWVVQAEVQMVAVPIAQAVALMPELRDAATFSAAEARLQKMIAAGEAELLGWPMADGVATRAAQSEERFPSIAITKAVEELRYLREFEPPQVPGWGGPAKSVVIITGNAQQTLWAPTAVDTHMAGPKLEIRGRIDEENTLVLKTKAELDWMAAVKPAIGARADRVNSPSREFPHFRQLSTEATLHVRRETRQLLGVFPERRAQPRMIFFLLHVRVQPAPQPL